MYRLGVKEPEHLRRCPGPLPQQLDRHEEDIDVDGKGYGSRHDGGGCVRGDAMQQTGRCFLGRERAFTCATRLPSWLWERKGTTPAY